MNPCQTSLALSRRTSLIYALSLLALPSPGFAITSKAQSGLVWPKPSYVPGGIVVLPLGAATPRPTAHAQEVPLLVTGSPAAWTALVGIALAATPGIASISVSLEDGTQRQIDYQVTPKKYLEQHLKVAPGTVDLSPENEARYQRERVHQATVIATFSEPAPPADALRMQLPVAGRRRLAESRDHRGLVRAFTLVACLVFRGEINRAGGYFEVLFEVFFGGNLVVDLTLAAVFKRHGNAGDPRCCSQGDAHQCRPRGGRACHQQRHLLRVRGWALGGGPQRQDHNAAGYVGGLGPGPVGLRRFRDCKTRRRQCQQAQCVDQAGASAQGKT